MTPSKLDKYFCVLRALVPGPQRADSVAFVAKMECNTVSQCLNYLVSSGLVEKRRSSSRRVVYAINERGLSVLRITRKLNYLKKLMKTLPIVEDSREAVSLLSEHSQKWKKK
jgi:DNA-binding PadR family transcriptional regulator